MWAVRSRHRLVLALVALVALVAVAKKALPATEGDAKGQAA